MPEGHNAMRGRERDGVFLPGNDMPIGVDSLPAPKHALSGDADRVSGDANAL
jgi:hypothetical protein